MSKDPIFFDVKTTSKDLLRLINRNPHNLYRVVQDGCVMGIVTRESILQRLDQDFTASDVIQTDFHSIDETSSAADAFEMMAADKNTTIVVVDKYECRGLVGLVTRIDIFNSMEHMDEKHHAF